MVKTFNERFLKERYEKDETFFTVYDYYTPNYHKAIVTGKFYAPHDALDLTQANVELVEDIKKHKDKLPRDKFPWPVTESHRYGWYEPRVYLNRRDRRFYVPLTMAPYIKHEIRIRQDKTMEKPKFTGIPFKL